MMRWLVGLLARLALRIAYLAHKAEGLNVLFLVLPARFLAPVLQKHGAVVGANAEIATPIIFHNVSSTPREHYRNLRIGDNCYLGKEVFLDLADQILIEDQVTISMRVTLLTHTHAGKSPLSATYLPPNYAPIILRYGCYIGAGAIILPGVEIGAEAVVGAGAVVNRNVPPAMVAVGVPARVISRNAKFDK